MEESVVNHGVDRLAAIELAKSIVNKGPLYFDTETTGLENNAEIVDIAIVDHDGEIILNTLVRPTTPIPAAATEKHGITDDMVENSPTFADCWPLIAALFRGRAVVSYNAAYDARLIAQSYVRPFPTVSGGLASMHIDYRCAMQLFARINGEWNDYYQSYRWKRLEFAAEAAGYPAWKQHRALGDTLAARAVMLWMAVQK